MPGNLVNSQKSDRDQDHSKNEKSCDDDDGGAMATSQLAFCAFWYLVLACHIYGLVAVEPGPGAGLDVCGGVVVRGRDVPGCEPAGAGGRIRAGAVRCTGASGVSLDGSWPLLRIALSIRSLPFSSLLMRMPSLLTVTLALPVTCCSRF